MENTRKMVLFVDCGAGTRSATAYLVPADMTQEDLYAYAWEAACQHGESYGYYSESSRPDNWEEDDEGETYVDHIDGWFVEYDAKEHDGQLIFGTHDSFTWNEL